MLSEDVNTLAAGGHKIGQTSTAGHFHMFFKKSLFHNYITQGLEKSTNM